VVEFAVSIPILLTMLFAMVNIGVLITDKVSAAYAARQGARLAANLGDGTASNLTTSQIDSNVCQAVLASAAHLAYATVTEIDIYQADTGTTNGAFDGTQPHDSYAVVNGSCNLLGTLGFPAGATGSRKQSTPNETSIGVRMLWTYIAPTGFQSFSLNLSDYTVMKATAVIT
jgi:hypothetical protein